MDAQPREASAICASHTRTAGRYCEKHIAPQTCRFTAGEGSGTLREPDAGYNHPALR